MKKAEIRTIGIFALLLAVLYFGFDTKAKDHGLVEKSRALKMSATDISILKNEAFVQLDKGQKGKVELLNAQLNNATDSIGQLTYLKELSGAWYQFGFSSIAGHYAETVADKIDNADAWGIAATTYALGIGKASTEKERKYCKQKAMEAFDKAITMDPSTTRHKLNRAITLADHPDADNPMKGIQSLLSLNKENPEDVSIINQLAKFGMQTNQLDKALERLNKALVLEPDNTMSICLMADLLTKRNESAKAELYITKCNNLRNTN